MDLFYKKYQSNNSPLSILSFFFFFQLFNYSSFSQDTIDATSFFSLSMAGTVPVQFNNKEVNFPWIESYEFRTETNEFDIERQEYLFRVSPSTRRKRKAQADMYRLLKDQPDTDLAERRCEQWLDRHLDWLYLHYSSQLLDLIEQLELVFQDRKLVIENEMNRLEYSVGELLDHEMEKNKLALDKFEIRNELEYLENKYGFNSPVYIFKNFVDIDQIPSLLINDSIGNNFDREEDQHELKLLEQELELEYAEKKQLFDFAQLRYQGPHSDPFEERLSLTAALQIPNSGNRKLKIEELLLDKKRMEDRMSYDQFELEAELNHLKLEIEKDTRYYNYFTDLIQAEEDFLENLSSGIKKREDFNPRDILDIRERRLKNEMDKIKLSHDIYENYLEYLLKSEIICHDYNTNWLEAKN